MLEVSIPYRCLCRQNTFDNNRHDCCWNISHGPEEKNFQWSEPQIHSRWLYPSDFEASLVLRLFVSISIRVKAEIDFNWKNIDSREFAETFYHEKSQKHEFKKKNELFFSNPNTKRGFLWQIFQIWSLLEKQVHVGNHARFGFSFYAKQNNTMTSLMELSILTLSSQYY